MIQAFKTVFTNLFNPPITHGYPFAPIVKPKNYRGLIEYNAEECIFCDKCEKACPPGAIHFTQALDGSKTYYYNRHLCIYCGDCVRECPKPDAALWQSEKKAMFATKADAPNDFWDVLEVTARESREAYKVHKAEEKKAAAAAKAAGAKPAAPKAEAEKAAPQSDEAQS